MIIETCPECNRLWRECISANAEYLKLKSQTDMLLHDTGLYEIAQRATEVAARHLEFAEIKMKEHETSHRPPSAAAARR